MGGEGLKAYILLKSSVGKVRSVYKNVKEMDFVNKANLITGDYDIILLIEMGDIAELGNTIEKIHKIDGIKQSTTMVLSEIQ